MLGSITLEKNADEVVFPLELFKQFDGTIVGHVHQHQIIDTKPFMCYIGSMECKDFGESELKKYFLVIDDSGEDLVFNFEKLPVRKLHDLKFDLSTISDNGEFILNLKKQLLEFSENNPLKDSIVRLTMFVSGSIINDFDMEEIKQYMKNELEIFHCVGIHPFLMSKKQLRKSSITENMDPKESFIEYIKDVFALDEREEVRAKIIECGLEIIKKEVS
jgi:DNA repair exonuclease SbcCD nuclease subunit